MAEQHSGLDEAVGVGTSALTGAKQLKAAGALAKGAATGGIIGAAVSTAIECRHSLKKGLCS